MINVGLAQACPNYMDTIKSHYKPAVHTCTEYHALLELLHALFKKKEKL